MSEKNVSSYLVFKPHTFMQVKRKGLGKLIVAYMEHVHPIRLFEPYNCKHM